MKMNDDSIDDNVLKDWEEMQLRINHYLGEILLKIEWHYGDCRAPFRYPPSYNLVSHKDKTIEYICTIKLDLGGDESLRFSSYNPEELYKKIKEDIDEKYAVK